MSLPEFATPVLVVLATLSAAALCSAAEFFVSPDGRDDWSGTIAQPRDGDGPFATLTRARNAAREAIRDRDTPVTVTIREGTYYVDQPLELGPQDSGTAETPVTWRAMPGEEVVLSGGWPIASEWEPHEGEIVRTTLPQVAGGDWYFRLLRIGDDWAIRARYPDFEPDAPYTGGWLFVKPNANAEGAFGSAVGNIHNAGDMMQWTIEVPETGDYNLFHYYAAENAPWGRTDMGGRVAFIIDGGEPIVLQNLQDTGSFRSFRWSELSATIHLEAGEHTIQWVNQQGGGLNYDAFVLCSAPDWRPEGTPPEPPEDGAMVLVHAETFEQSRGKELSVNLPASKRHFGFAPEEMPRVQDFADVQMHVFPAWGWVSSIEPIETLDYDEGIGTLAGREANQELRVGNRYYLSGAYELLDSPGEWHLDRESGTLYYWPRGDELDTAEVVAPVHDRIIHVRGEPGEDVGHISFIGLTFKDTTYTPRIDSPYSPPDAAIWLEHARGCLIEDCRFTRTGGSALKLLGDARENRFLGNTVEHVGQSGVTMDRADDGDLHTAPMDNVVAGCHMHHIGLVYKHVAGVYLGSRDPSLAQEPGNLIAHNFIHDVPRYAVGIKMSQGNTVVEYNEIRRTNLETNDTGGIESCVRNENAAGNTFRHNLVVDSVGLKHTSEGGIITPYYTWGIYLDDHSSHALVYGNICVRNWRGGAVVHGGRENVIENNIFVDSELAQAEFNNIGTAMVQNVFRRNICYRPDGEALMLRSGRFTDEVLAECDRNLYWSVGSAPEELEFIGRSLEAWREAGYDLNSLVTDPLFVDPEADDYRLQDDSPAFDLGFERIPIERIGLAGYDRANY
ncbi:MAG: carbohydrate-binding protein [Armatimonadia bacterium]|nr:carbohydrate-binding protein [Armatimonadia bacterium]